MSKLVVCLSSNTEKTKLWELTEGKNSTITLNKLWETHKFVIDDPNSFKILKSVEVVNAKPFSVTISTGKDLKTISFLSSSSKQTKKVDLNPPFSLNKLYYKSVFFSGYLSLPA